MCSRQLKDKMGEEDGLRTLECLRGRLLAERSASRNAKEEAEQTENKLVELEAQLKKEVKSRKKAEKRLKLLMKRVQSLKMSNPSYVFDGSDQSCSFDKSEVTSVSSYASCTSKRTEDKKEFTTKRLIENTKLSAVVSENFNQDILLSRNSISSKGHKSAGEEETISSVGEAKADDGSLISSNEEYKDIGEDNASSNDVDYSMALVPADLPKTEEPSRDVVVLDTTVKEVLDSLRRVKEKLQISMEQRRTVRVG